MVHTLITVINIILAIFTFWAEGGFVILAKRMEDAALEVLDILVYTHKTLRVCVCVCICTRARACVYKQGNGGKPSAQAKK